jgi:hypothetical protein
MNAKIPKAKQKIADITPPSKGAGAALPQIVIEKRAHLERPEGPGADSAASAPVSPSARTDATNPAPAATTNPTPSIAPTPQAQAPTVPKRTVITPPEDTDVTTAEASSETPEAETNPTTTTPAATEAAAPASIDTDIDEEPDATDTPSEAVDEAKAAKEAEAAARREGELEKFIDTKQFFVPINKEAQKRSIKVTLWLTALYIVLSLLLINLMLDTGMILLLQKLPHTNFFSV